MTKYDLFRRRIAPIAFGLAIVLIARDACNKEERTNATIVLDYGSAESRVHAIDAEVWSEGSLNAKFHRVALPGQKMIGPSRFKLLTPSKDGELRFDVDVGTDDHRKFTRRFHADEDATITIPLESDLR
ncbi:MAG: hypothetical protein JWO36_2334 [Myxococcales bacterium]|nr:hypothetical protein [Myxococcales bacterium]